MKMKEPILTAPTHRTIARAAGVSSSTVSLALRNDTRVAPGTSAKIRSTAESLGYRANPSVSMWMAHVRTTRPPRFQEVIAYVHTIPRDHSYRRYVPFDLYRKGAGERASRLGYQVRDFELHDQGMTSKRLRQILAAQGIRGLLLEYADFEEFHQYSIDFDWTGLSTVSLGARPSEIPIHNVSSCHFDAAMLAYQKLVALGYSRIGLSLHMFCDRSVDFETSGGFLCAQSLHPEALRLPIHNIDVFQGWDRKGFCEWYEQYKPDAILSPNSEIFEFIRHLGLRVPDDIGWVHLAKSRGSSFTGIDHHPEQIGSVAVDLLSNFLHLNETGQAEVIRRELIEPAWCDGATVRKIEKRPASPARAIRPVNTPLRVYSRSRDWQAPGQDHDRLIR